MAGFLSILFCTLDFYVYNKKVDSSISSYYEFCVLFFSNYVALTDLLKIDVSFFLGLFEANLSERKYALSFYFFLSQ